jgi:dTDP-4-amino-4,6-dideoxygalactose transaminase
MNNQYPLFKENLAKRLLIYPRNISFFWKGRVALYAILKAISVKGGDEVILPAFTCVVAVNPIIYLGAKPVYVDIEPITYNIDVSKIEGKITDKTKAIMAQNTFGLAPDLDRILEVAHKYNLTVIEDCAHGFGGFYKGKANGTIADVSFFSSQWNKPFSTGLGGFAVTKNSEIAAKLAEMEQSFIQPSFKDEIVLKTLIFLKEKLNPNLYWPAIKTYRWLSKNNLILGSSQGEELTDPVKPEGFEKRFSQTQAKKGIEELSRLDTSLKHRKKIASSYKKILSELGIQPPHEPNDSEHTFLKFPLLVKDRANFFNLAEKEKIELGDWFVSPIHPITEKLERWKYHWGDNPIAEKISQHMVNLPTHMGVTDDEVKRIGGFLQENREGIFRSYEDLE